MQIISIGFSAYNPNLKNILYKSKRVKAFLNGNGMIFLPGENKATRGQTAFRYDKGVERLSIPGVFSGVADKSHLTEFIDTRADQLFRIDGSQGIEFGQQFPFQDGSGFVMIVVCTANGFANNAVYNAEFF